MAKKLEFINTLTAAKELGAERKTIERLIQSGKLHAYRHGRHYRILRSDWETYKARNMHRIVA